MTSRGKNFTERERCKLMELVQKYKNIIENKCTNAISIQKKNEAWEAITTEFNSTAEVPRSQKQLCTAYLNMKRTTRQNIANENIKKYLEHSPTTSSPLVDEPNMHTKMVEVHGLLKQFKKDEVADKKGVMATGGGLHKPVLSSVGAQMLAIMGDQVKPLSNNCDSASNYFLNDENVMSCEVLPLDDIQQPSCSQNYIYTPSQTSITMPQTSSSQDCNEIPPIPKTTKPKNKRKVPQKIRLAKNTNMLKKEYYLKKLECVNIEKKTKLLEYKINLKKHKLLDLEIRIKQNEYDSLKK